MSKTIMNKILASFIGALPMCVIACMFMPLCCPQGSRIKSLQQYGISTSKKDKIKTLLRYVKSGNKKKEIFTFFNTEITRAESEIKIKVLIKSGPNLVSNLRDIAELEAFVHSLRAILTLNYSTTSNTTIQQLAANIQKRLSVQGLDQIYAQVTGSPAQSKPMPSTSGAEPMPSTSGTESSNLNRRIRIPAQIDTDFSASESDSSTSSTRSSRPGSIGSARSRSRSPYGTSQDSSPEAFNMYTPEGASRPAHEDASHDCPIMDYSAVAPAHTNPDLGYITVELLHLKGLFRSSNELRKIQKLEGLLYCMKNRYMESEIVNFFVEHVNRTDREIDIRKSAIDSTKTPIEKFFDLISTELPDAETERLRQSLGVSRVALEQVVSDMSRFDDTSIRLVASFIDTSMTNEEELNKMWNDVIRRLESDKDMYYEQHPEHPLSYHSNHALEGFDISDTPRG